MPIRKLTETQDWIDASLPGKTNGLEPDVWSDATKVASKLLFIEKINRLGVERRIASQFRTSRKEAQAVVDAVIEAEAEPITIFEPTLRAKTINSDANMRLIRAGLINEVHCLTQQGKTVTAAKNAYGESYTILSAFESDETVAELASYFDEALGEEYNVAVFTVADGYKGLEEWLMGVGQHYSSMGFSHNVLRGVADEETPNLSVNLFDGANDRRPFSQ